MIITGFEKTALRDWEGMNPCKILLHGCDFRCPFCNRPDLIGETPSSEVDIRTILDYIDGKRDFVNAAVISGGEPTCNPDLYRLLKDLKKTGIKISLETNGNTPDNLDDLIGSKLIDRVAMNIVSPLNAARYSVAAGVEVDISNIQKSVDLILDCGIDNEFRTVAVPGLTDIGDVESIAKTVKGADSFAIYRFNPKNTLNPEYTNIKPYPNPVLMKMAEAAKKYVKNVKIKGYDPLF